MPSKYKKAVKKITASYRKQGKPLSKAKQLAHATATKKKIGGGPCKKRR